MRQQLKKYIEAELKTLRFKGDKVSLENVYPSLLEDIVGDFTPYELNGYDCDYFATTDKYEIDGCMRFGTAEITLIVGQSQPDKPVGQQTTETSSSQAQHLTIDDVPEEVLANLKTFYFTFGYGQRFEGKVQPIMAKDASVAHKKMVEIYGTKWAFRYTEDKWQSFKDLYRGNVLETIVALE